MRFIILIYDINDSFRVLYIRLMLKMSDLWQKFNLPQSRSLSPTFARLSSKKMSLIKKGFPCFHVSVFVFKSVTCCCNLYKCEILLYRVIHMSCRILLSFYSLMTRDMDLKLIKSSRVKIDILCVKISAILVK